jgi:hypothetical protein
MPEKTIAAAKAVTEPAARGALRETASPAVVSMILGLQQTSGNHAVGMLLGGALLQPKLRIGPPGDTFEREADYVADRMLREKSETPIPVSVAHAPSRVQRQCHCQDDELVQRQCHCQEEEDETLQPKAASGRLRHAAGLEARVDALRGSGRPLTASVRRFFEPRFGHDFAPVRVHTGAAASDATNAIGARAFTVGHDVVFGAGEWSPGTAAGKHLLAHELTHVVQQTPLVARRKPILDRAAELGEAVPGTEDSVTEPESATPSQETPTQEPRQDEPSSEAAPPEQTASAAVVVEDDATEVGEGQMKKSDFLARVRPEVCAAAEAGLSGTEHSAQGCPFIEFAFGYYDGQSADRLNRDLPRFIGEGQRPATAEEYIAAIVQRVRVSVEVWARTGVITGVPRAMLLAGMSLPEIQGGGAKAAASRVQFKARRGGARAPGDPGVLRDELGAGRPLEGSLRSRMESALGRSFSQVHVHTDGRAAELSQRLNARAFTVGNHVAFGAREYRPGTLVGDALMAHELAHVAQQSGAAESVQPMATDKAGYGALERDADAAAVGAVATLWGLRLPTPRLPFRAGPRLSSGVRLQRCGDCNGKEKTPTAPAAPDAAPPAAAPKCCDFETFTSSGDTYTDSDKDTKKNIKFTFKVKPGADEKKCVMVNWVKGHSKSVKTGKPFKVTMFEKDVDYDFADLRIDSLDKDPVYWSKGGTRWRYDPEGKDSFFATDNPGPALRGEDWDLTFQMCLHCTDDVDKTSDAAGSGVKNPLKCIDWTFKAKYDKKKKAWEH